MTIESTWSTNGHSSNGASPRRAEAEPPVARSRRRTTVRPRKLMLPVLLALGVIVILRYFEQSTAAG